MIYLPDGRRIRRVMGFCDFTFEAIREESQVEGKSSLADLIGSSESYWSETEERYLDREEDK